MFNRIVSEALGLSDIGKIISPCDYDKVDADNYIFHEDEEKIFFLIKSKKDEYCFTNKALLHIDGETAISSKRLLKRYEYEHNTFSNVMLETAGTIDLDAEIKFKIEDTVFSIDVEKAQIEQLKDLYKALFEIAKIQKSNAKMFDYAFKSLDIAKDAVGGSMTNSKSIAEEFAQITEDSFDFIKQIKETYVIKDFSDIYERYINN